jgi:hypothetical protein
LKFGGIDNEKEMRANLRTSCVPEAMLDGEILDYDEFLAERRKLMSGKIRSYFETL